MTQRRAVLVTLRDSGTTGKSRATEKAKTGGENSGLSGDSDGGAAAMWTGGDRDVDLEDTADDGTAAPVRWARWNSDCRLDPVSQDTSEDSSVFVAVC